MSSHDNRYNFAEHTQNKRELKNGEKNEKVVQKLRGKKEKGVATDAAESQKASLFFLYGRPPCQGEQQRCSKIL